RDAVVNAMRFIKEAASDCVKCEGGRRDGLLVLAEMAIAKYVKEMRERSFPGPDYTYPIKDTELTAVSASDYWKAAVDGQPVASARRS
ncbi:MAG: hypothetical protein JXA57_18835, partial [Armatimonadetes bacterium]|nr:hypothetical protein [Armatimonadota bacterium]